MAIINTRSHIVLDKEGLRNYADLMNLSYRAILELNTKMDAYQVLFHTGDGFPGISAGTGQELLAAAKQHVHKDEQKELLSAFRKRKLQSIIKKGIYKSIDFRSLSPEGDYRWMRAFLIPDETASDTILCILMDIEMQKRCVMLERIRCSLP